MPAADYEYGDTSEAVVENWWHVIEPGSRWAPIAGQIFHANPDISLCTLYVGTGQIVLRRRSHTGVTINEDDE